MRWKLIVAGALAYAVALIAMLPATLADAALQRASGGHLRVTEAHGTLWSGAGQIEMRGAHGQAGFAKPLAWQVHPAALLRAQLAYELTLEEAGRPFEVSVSWSRIAIENATLRLPAAALGLGIPTLAPLRLSGDLQLRVPRFSIEHGNTHGSAALRWHTAASALSPVSPLGDYELRLEGEGPAVRATLQTLQGPLQLDGQGAWTRGAQPVFLATAQMPPEVRPQLAPFLRLIAVERKDGSFEMRINTILTGIPNTQTRATVTPGRPMYVRAQRSPADRATKAHVPE